MKINNDIRKEALSRVRHQKELDDYIKVCFEAGLCPDCGGDIESVRFGTGIPPLLDIKCKVCDFAKVHGEKIVIDQKEIVKDNKKRQTAMSECGEKIEVGVDEKELKK